MISEHDLDELERIASFGLNMEGLRSSPVEISNKGALDIVHTIRHLQEYKVRLEDALRGVYRDLGKPGVADDVIKSLWKVSEQGECDECSGEGQTSCLWCQGSTCSFCGWTGMLECVACSGMGEIETT